MAESQGIPVQPDNTINPIFNAQGNGNRTPGCPLSASLTAGECFVSKADDEPDAQCIGLAERPAIDGDRVNIKYAGPLTLTTAEWDVILHNVVPAGLVAGAAYYLDASTAGKLTETPPSAGGTFLNQIGIALSTTTMLVQISGAFEN